MRLLSRLNGPAPGLRQLQHLVIVLCAFSCTVQATAQNVGPGGLATRSGTHYLQLERALITALSDRKSDALSALLDSGFDFRSSGNSDPVSGEDWMHAELTKPTQIGVLRDLAVVETDGVDIVSFHLDPVSGKKSPHYFIVDVWQKASNRLVVRYATLEAGAGRKDRRPDGRE